MDLSFGTSGVPILPGVTADSPYTKCAAGQNPLAMPRAISVAAQVGHDVLIPTSFFRQVETLRHFVARARLQPLTPTRTDRDEKKRRSAFIQSVIINKSEATGNKQSGK